MDDTTFLATWDDTDDVGIVNLTKADLKELTTSAKNKRGTKKGKKKKKSEHINSMLKHLFHWYRASSDYQKSDEK